MLCEDFSSETNEMTRYNEKNISTSLAFTHLHFLQSSSASFLQKTRDAHKGAEFHLLMERFTIYQQLQNRDKLLLSDGRFDYFLCNMKNNGRRDKVNEGWMEG